MVVEFGDDLTIRPHGPGFWTTLVLVQMGMGVSSIIGFILGLVKIEEVLAIELLPGLNRYFIAVMYFLLTAFFAIFITYEFIKMYLNFCFKFKGGSCTTGRFNKSKKSRKHEIYIECKDFIDYGYAMQNFLPAIQFTFASGKKKVFFSAWFTDRQVVKILQEIQVRGGLVGQEISMEEFKRKMRANRKKGKR
ncbi:MAG: hypothetical protein FWH03_08255 [Firmicutes bacterium]|nr:hypothetical protein [Bacillota bacterium]